MYKINLSFSHLPYPYQDATYRPALCWGQIKLVVADQSERLIRSIFDWQWDIRPVLQWLLDYKQAILTEALPAIISQFPGNSIAEKMDYFRHLDIWFDDTVYDIVRNYTSCHNFSFSLPGVDTDDIFFGLYEGNLQVSYKSDDTSWHYSIQMNDLFVQAEQIINHYHIEFDGSKLYTL